MTSPIFTRAMPAAPPIERRGTHWWIESDGVEVRLSNLDKVYWPGEGITKGDLVAYYRAVAPVLLPHLRNRPFTIKRHYTSPRSAFVWEKDAPAEMPSWIRVCPQPAKSRGGALVRYPLVNSRRALLWMVEYGCVDLHVWPSRADRPDRPDFVLFDLDPSPDVGFPETIRVARLIKETLDLLELESFPKTSGSEGIHVLVPIARRSGFRETHAFAEAVSTRLAKANPGVITTEWLKRKRDGVLLDYHQNGAGKTIASVYSVRPKPGAPVSTPLRWDELTEDVTPRRFGMREALERVEQHGDLFEPVLAGGQALGRALRKLPGGSRAS